MESDGQNVDEASSPVAGIVQLASASQQAYFSELLSFTLDRLHKVRFLNFLHIWLFYEACGFSFD